MFKKTILVGLVCCLLAPVTAFADGLKNPYFSASGGIFWAEDASIGSPDATLNATAKGANARVELDPGVAFSFSAGAEIMPKIRGEVEYSFRNSDGDKLKSDVGSVDLTGFDADIHALMFNSYYDFASETKWKPYLGGGIGFSWINIEGSGLGVTVDTTSDAEFAYQLMAGLGYDYSSNITLNTGYRYFGSSDATFDNVANASVDGHGLEFGIRYSF